MNLLSFKLAFRHDYKISLFFTRINFQSLPKVSFRSCFMTTTAKSVAVVVNCHKAVLETIFITISFFYLNSQKLKNI